MFNGFKDFVQKTQVAIYAIVLGTALIWYVTYVETIRNQNSMKRQQIVCPSFLSIARSARDTLIVMRNEPLCNRYVLDNLQ